MNFYGYKEDGTKVYYSTTNPTFSFSVVPDDENLLTSSTLGTKNLTEDLRDLGFSEVEITNILNKIDNVNQLNSTASPVSNVDPITGTTSTNSKGSLVSNSAQSLKNNTEFQKATLEIEKAKLSAMKASNDIQKKHLDLLDYNLIAQSEIIGQLSSLDTTLKAIVKKTNINNVSVNVDTSSLSIANEKIALGVENQIATNLKLVEKLNQELNKDISIDGKMYSKIELEKKKDAEILKNVKDENETLLNDALELVEDFLTDGFDLAFNPIESIMNNIKISLRDEANEIKTKYNLKESEV